jgi:histidine triad (HIT) family protein
MTKPSLFTRILHREIPGTVVHEDDVCFALQDVRPQAPTHLLFIPKKEIPSIAAMTPEDQAVVGHIFLKIAETARKLGLDDSGYRVVTNIGEDAGQTVPHLHFHLLGGRSMTWPPG